MRDNPIKALFANVKRWKTIPNLLMKLNHKTNNISTVFEHQIFSP